MVDPSTDTVALRADSAFTAVTLDQAEASTAAAAPPEAPRARVRGVRRLFTEPMWVLGLVILMDEVDKNIVRGMITPIQDEFAVGVASDEKRVVTVGPPGLDRQVLARQHRTR